MGKIYVCKGKKSMQTTILAIIAHIITFSRSFFSCAQAMWLHTFKCLHAAIKMNLNICKKLFNAMCTFIKEERMKSTRGNKSFLQYHFAYIHISLIASFSGTSTRGRGENCVYLWDAMMSKELHSHRQNHDFNWT